MKTQKVEIEVPVFDGYEFVEYGLVKIKHDLDKNYIYDYSSNALELEMVIGVHVGKFHFIYKKKKPRRIIFEETGLRKLVRGDYYRDIFGNISEWKLPNESTCKYTVLKKIHDDFGENND